MSFSTKTTGNYNWQKINRIDIWHGINLWLTRMRQLVFMFWSAEAENNNEVPGINTNVDGIRENSPQGKQPVK